MAVNSKVDSKQSLIFTYGTLKRGFHNHLLMQDLISHDDAVYVGYFQTHDPYPLVCGPHGIPYLIHIPGAGHRVRGELYSVSTRGLSRLDELEGTSFGHYERLPVRVVRVDDGGGSDPVEVQAEAYYAHRSFGDALWNRNLREGLREFSETENGRHVKRHDRPDGGRNILEDVRLFIASSATNR